MPNQSKTFEFYNPWITRNTHTSQCSITMPQMVNGQAPDPILTIYSYKLPAAGYYGMGYWTHALMYVIEGGFIGNITAQISMLPNPGDNDWVTLNETLKRYVGVETTGGAGISGGFSGAVSHPTKTDLVQFVGNYAWVRMKLDISRGTMQAIKMNF